MILGIVAGEPSGDRLGAGLMREVGERLHSQGRSCRFVGIGGELMLAEGLESVVSMERLSMNGFVEPVRRLPDLVRILRQLLTTYRELGPQAFIGIDFNVFNFLLERILKGRSVPTAHYVSPSVYAWRHGRVRRIARSTDLLLTLYPFEPAFYADSSVEAVFVGHPLADEIDLTAGDPEPTAAARIELGIADADPVVAVLPGSRISEVKLMAEGFLVACERFQRQFPAARFVIPCLRPEIERIVAQLLERHRDLQVVCYAGNARLGLTACDVALVKSGTSTLEAMLLHRPMVVSYRLGELTYQLVRRLLRTPYVALPNILKGSALVPELLQHEATPEALADKLFEQLDKRSADAEYLAEFEVLHAGLRRGADQRAAEALLGWLDALPAQASDGSRQTEIP